MTKIIIKNTQLAGLLQSPRDERLGRISQPGSRRVRRLLHRPERDHRHRLLPAGPQHPHLRRGLLPARQDASGDQESATAAQLRDRLHEALQPQAEVDGERDRRRDQRGVQRVTDVTGDDSPPCRHPAASPAPPPPRPRCGHPARPAHGHPPAQHDSPQDRPLHGHLAAQRLRHHAHVGAPAAPTSQVQVAP